MFIEPKYDYSDSGYNINQLKPGASFEGAGGPSPSPKEKEKKRKKRKKRKKKEKKGKKERKKRTMDDVKLLHIKCCFFQFFNSPVALKNN